MNNERLRLKAVKRYLKLFPASTDKLQDIAALASQITGVPVAFITLMDKEVQWITVKHGYPVEQMPRSTSFCTHTIEQNDVLVVPDAMQDERFTANPLVINPPSVKYYAGISLKSVDGYNVGTLCVMDVKTHRLTFEQLEALKALSRQVSNILELNITIDYLNRSIRQIERHNKTLKKIAHVQSHDIREPLTSVMGVVNLIKSEERFANKQYLTYLEQAVNRLDEKIKMIVNISTDANTLEYELLKAG